MSRAVPVPERTDSCGPSWSSLPFRAVYLPPWPSIPPLARREPASSHGIHLDYRSDPAHPSRDACSGDRTPTTSPPSTRHRASTPAHVATRFGFEEPSSNSRSVLVVLHHLDGFLRSEVAGLLHPAADPGVRRVSAVCRLVANRRTGGLETCDAFPATLLRTLRRIPLADSRTASPQPLPSCRFQRSDRRVREVPVSGFIRCTPSDRSLGSKALLRPRVRSACSTVSGGAAPYPSMGFVPLQGSSIAGLPPPAMRRRQAPTPKSPAARHQLRSAPS